MERLRRVPEASVRDVGSRDASLGPAAPAANGLEPQVRTTHG